MKRLFLTLIICSGIFWSCSDSETPSSKLVATINGKDFTFNLVSAKYSPVTQSADLIFLNSKKGYLDISLFGLTKLEDFTTGDYSWENCQVIVVLSRPSKGTVATSDENEASITLSNVVQGNGSVSVTASAGNATLYDPFLEETIVISAISFKANIKEKATDDFISFEVGGNQYYFATDELSGYDYYLTMDDMDLVLTANLSGWPLAYSLEGVTLEITDFTYPPTAQTVSGYGNGLRLYYNFDESLCGENFQEYNSGYNSIDDIDNTTMTITKVESIKGYYVLTGTFSGRITSYESFDNYLNLTNGNFRVTIPKIK